MNGHSSYAHKQKKAFKEFRLGLDSDLTCGLCDTSAVLYRVNTKHIAGSWLCCEIVIYPQVVKNVSIFNLYLILVWLKPNAVIVSFRKD